MLNPNLYRAWAEYSFRVDRNEDRWSMIWTCAVALVQNGSRLFKQET